MKPQDFTLDFRSGVPVYIQLVEQVQAHLARGVLKPGEQLPTVRQMASELRVNFNTIARAYRMLDEAGLISTQQGRGTYILEPLEDDKNRFLKHSTLQAQVTRFVNLLASQGFTPQEVEDCLREYLEAWKTGKIDNVSSFKIDDKE